MNIENLPVFRDHHGPFGSPTSDSERTMITMNTKNILLVFLNFGTHEDLGYWMQQTSHYLITFANASEIRQITVRSRD